MKSFTNKVSMITGGASGIGKSLGKELARMGADVILCDLDGDLLKKTVSELSGFGGTVTGKILDVTDYEAFKKTVEEIITDRGRLDYCFNNAGIAIVSEIRDMTPEYWENVMNVNLNGVFHGSLISYTQMLKQGFGHIVNISSIEGLMPFPTTAAYAASKYAVLGFTQSLWVEAKGLGVNISVVCPGYIKTPIFGNMRLKNIDREKYMERAQMVAKTGTTPDKCARTILKGVSKNKPIIPVTGIVHVLWHLARLAPVGLMKFIRWDYDRWRDSVRKGTI